jgi:hypothetical protein
MIDFLYGVLIIEVFIALHVLAFDLALDRRDRLTSDTEKSC